MGRGRSNSARACPFPVNRTPTKHNADATTYAWNRTTSGPAPFGTNFCKRW